MRPYSCWSGFQQQGGLGEPFLRRGYEYHDVLLSLLRSSFGLVRIKYLFWQTGDDMEAEAEQGGSITSASNVVNRCNYGRMHFWRFVVRSRT